MKVFLIDDEVVVNFITKRLLGQITGQLDIHEFTDAFKAMEAIRMNHPDLIFLDLNMPKLNGWAFLDKMREENLTNAVVILSSSVSRVDQERAAQYSNVLEFIEKPAKKDDLKRCIDSYNK